MSEQDFIEVGTKTPTQVFSKILASKVQEYVKAHTPFCEPCCRLDFADKLEAAEKESLRVKGYAPEDLGKEIGDLDKYGDADNFTLLEDQEDVQDKVMEGMRTQVVIGHTLSYKCKKRGHGIAVFIPISIYNEMKKAENKKPIKKKEE